MYRNLGSIGVCLWLCGFVLVARAQPQAASGSLVEIRRFPAAEAVQGVAVDEAHVYVVASRAIGKYDKTTGEKVGEWTETEQGPILHLDSGVIVGDRLYAAHSNYPGIPMTSSIEIWDRKTLEHVGSHSFGIYRGSATWVDFHDGFWWVAFAHYGGRSGEPGKDPSWTSVVRFDEHWQERGAWVLPAEVIERMTPFSNSGGSWGTNGLLYLTGHDRAEVYVMRLPTAGSVLELVDVLDVTTPGQGIAWDRSGQEPMLYGIDRARREVVVFAPNQPE